MAQDLFRVEQGFADDNVHYISGTGLPSGSSGRTLSAPKGSYYTDISTGIAYRKKGIAGVAGDWEKLLDQADYNALSQAIAAAGSNTEVQSIEDSVGLQSDGTLGTPFAATNYLSAAGSVIAAEVALDAQVKTVSNAANAAAAAASSEAIRATGVEGGLDTRLTTVEGGMVKKDGSVAFTGDQSMGGNKLTNVATPVADTDAANKGFVTGEIAKLGNAFDYVGTVDGGATAGAAFNLATLTDKVAGSYYKVAIAGYFKVGAGAAFYANVNDGLVFNLTSGVDIIDNSDSTVAGTTDFIAVSGSTDTGFTVDIDAAFKARVSTLENEVGNAQIASGLTIEGNYAADATTNYLKTVSTLKGADKALDAQIKVLADAQGVMDTKQTATATLLLAARKESSATNITASTMVDEVSARQTEAAKWIVYVKGNAAGNVRKRQAIEVLAMHNGTDTVDADVIDYTSFAKLKIGMLADLQVSVELVGTGAAQRMQLRVSSTDAVDVFAIRERIPGMDAGTGAGGDANPWTPGDPNFIFGAAYTPDPNIVI